MSLPLATYSAGEAITNVLPPLPSVKYFGFSRSSKRYGPYPSIPAPATVTANGHVSFSFWVAAGFPAHAPCISPLRRTLPRDSERSFSPGAVGFSGHCRSETSASGARFS